MSLDVTASVDIDAAPAVVAAVQFDPERDPEWIGGVNRIERITPGPIGRARASGVSAASSVARSCG